MNSLFSASDNIAEIATALAKAQGVVKGALKDNENPHFRSKYADLASVWDACREALSSNGLAVVQLPGRENGDLVMTTVLTHSSGQWIAGKLSAKPVKDDPQAIGSATTYLRRYALAAMVGVAPEDDDGNAASGVSGGLPARAAPAPARPTASAAKPAEGTKAEPKHAAWVRKAEAEIDGCRSREGLSEWEQKNRAAMDKLAELDEAERKRLSEVIGAKFTALPSILKAG